jgi:glucokinase
MAGTVAGIELADSGTRLVVALSPERGARRWFARLSQPPSATEALAAMHELVARALRESGDPAAARREPDVAIGVALAGTVDMRRGVVRTVALAEGWQDFPLADALAQRWGAPAVVQTTTQAAALAEARLGAGQGHADLLYVLLGRSVSAALVLSGRVYPGAHGMAGDLAHWRVGPDGPLCSCGQRGHLGPIASAQSIVRAMIGRAVDHPESSAAMLAITGGRAEAMAAAQVAELAASGDPVARGVMDEALGALASALANLIAALDPAAIVLGGPLAAASGNVLDPLAERVRRLTGSRPDLPPLLAGELEPAAALIGAVLSAQERRSQG